jgi:phosphate transport system permease protein
MQTVWRLVLPSAVPGIATGIILALSRAIGEAAPILLVGGGLIFITFNPDGLDSRFTVLPIQIYNWTSRPQAEFRNELAAAAIMVMFVILLATNSAAIVIRNKFRKSW